MAPDLGGWIHNFTVTDTQTHKGGYTLYKITSIVSIKIIFGKPGNSFSLVCYI